MEINKENEFSLLDTLHRCLRCNAEAFEYEKNKFKCNDPECEFTWKVMVSE